MMATTVGAAFTELHDRQKLTSKQNAVAVTRIETLQSWFNTNFEMQQKVFAIGSFKRGTICAGERDIDLMACLNRRGNERYWSRFSGDSSKFLYWVRDQLNERYWATKVSSKRVCVKLDFTNIVTDVTPCFDRIGGGYWMPDGKGDWMATNPPFHANLIANADAEKNGRLKPLIRLMKAWNIANGHHLSSFHLEMMIEWAQRGQTIHEFPFEVGYTLKQLYDLVQYNFTDPWMPNTLIDSYLTTSERELVLRLLDEDRRRAELAEEYRKKGYVSSAFAEWDKVYHGAFPAYG